MTSPHVATRACPVCGVHSVYTNGRSACSLRCAVQLAQEIHEVYGVSLERAIERVSRECRAWGLPTEPAPEDRFRYRYVKVYEERTSRYWEIDRALLLDAKLNVEYTWIGAKPSRGRVYRFSPQVMQNLPSILEDYKVQSYPNDDLDYVLMWWEEPYWHFLEAPL